MVPDMRPSAGVTSKVFRCTLNGTIVAAKRFRIVGTVRKKDKQVYLILFFVGIKLNVELYMNTRHSSKKPSFFVLFLIGIFSLS